MLDRQVVSGCVASQAVRHRIVGRECVRSAGKGRPGKPELRAVVNKVRESQR